MHYSAQPRTTETRKTPAADYSRRRVLKLCIEGVQRLTIDGDRTEAFA